MRGSVYISASSGDLATIQTVLRLMKSRRHDCTAKRHRPEDWKIVLEYFPLADLEVWRFERFIEGRGPEKTAPGCPEAALSCR